MTGTVSSHRLTLHGKLAILAIFAIFLCAACARDDAPQTLDEQSATTPPPQEETESTAETSDPCSLVSAEKIASITGVAVANTIPQGNRETVGSCVYGNAERPAVLQIGTVRGADARAGYESSRSDSAVTVEGLGDEALWVPDFRILAVVRGDLYLAVNIADPSLGDGDSLKQWAVAVAELALAAQ